MRKTEAQEIGQNPETDVYQRPPTPCLGLKSWWISPYFKNFKLG